MKTLALAFGILVAAASARAQVSVEVRMEQVEFVSKEAMPISVRIVNHSGQTLHFGKDPDWLVFSIEAADGHVVNQLANVPVEGEFDLPSSKVAIKKVDVAPYFNLNRFGRYVLHATVKMKDWQVEISNEKPALFEITPGTRMWEQTFGLPPADGESHAKPELRKYILQQVNYTHQMKLYLRITDPLESEVIKVLPIGPMVSFSRPDTMLDQHSNLHLIYQCGARLYNYSVVAPDGTLLIRQAFDVTSTRPHLRVDERGHLGVVDGARRLTSEDVPPTPDPRAPAPAPAPAPPNESKPPKA